MPATIRPFSANLALSLCNTGMVSRQLVHQVAQKSITTTLPFHSLVSWDLPSRSGRTKAGRDFRDGEDAAVDEAGKAIQTDTRSNREEKVTKGRMGFLEEGV